MEQKLEIINDLDSLVLSILQDTCEDLLGKFKENKRSNETSTYNNFFKDKNESSQQDFSSIYEDHEEASTINLSIRIFKDHMKSYSGSDQNYIEPNEPNGDPVEEAYHYYEDFYKIKKMDLRNYPRDEILGRVDIGLSNFITVDKIKNKINKLPSNRACGLNGIHTVILQNINDSKFPLIFFYLFQMCIELCVIPERWNKLFIYPIPKKARSKYISDFQPISITNIFRKIFELLILDYIQERLRKNF